MNCKECQRRIVDELASGEMESSREVVAHRAICGSCAEFYDEQVALFSRIDAGMRSLANEAEDPSLVAKAKHALLEQPRRWVVPVWGYAAVAAVCALILTVTYAYHRPAEVTSRAERSAVQVSAPSTANASVAQVEVRPKDVNHPAKTSLRKATIANPTVESAALRPDLEIVVSEDERRAFAHWVRAIPKQRDSLVALTKPTPSKPEQPIEIALVKLDSVDVKGVKTEEPSMK